jgi:hypothetical protein
MADKTAGIEKVKMQNAKCKVQSAKCKIQIGIRRQPEYAMHRWG